MTPYLHWKTMLVMLRSMFGSVVVAGMLAGTTGCNLTRDPGLPAGTPDPQYFNTKDGAVGMRNSALFQVNLAVGPYILESGLISDEMQDPAVGQSTFAQPSQTPQDPLDERILPEGNDLDNRVGTGGASYGLLQDVRGNVSLALRALALYDTTAADRPEQHVMRGELFAMQGYAEILLADLFCSGVPLSTLDYGGDFTYVPSSSTSEVYTDAKQKLDSALILAAANDTVLNMARVLKGRTQLALGNYAAAADDVSTVPATFEYRLNIPRFFGDPSGSNQFASVSDREGTNGLPYRSDADPRVGLISNCIPSSPSCPIDTLWIPAKYSVSASYNTFVLANGIEAQLIRAEAQLQPATAPSGPWLATLNTLRESAGLSDTTDPGTAERRVSLLFRERAYWLYATGHRQGDMRRLLRQYNAYPTFRAQQQVYPVGVYNASGTGSYGSDVNAPIPAPESANPYFHGCLDRNA